MPELNADGVSVKGCNYIYAPKGQAGEYAPLATNPYRGCGHACAYCYVPLVTKQDRKEFDAGAEVRKKYAFGVEADAKKYEQLGITEQVMMSFTTDPFHPGDITMTAFVMGILRRYGLGFCTLTKGGSRALPFMEYFRPRHDAFATTLTTLDDSFSKKWERNAALPGDRIDTLRAFYRNGIFTWVSLEPTLDVEASIEIVRETHQFVDLFKIGRANYLKEITTTTDWRAYTLRMIDVCQQLDVRHYIKRDLQEYLPPNYPNPLRVQQHH